MSTGTLSKPKILTHFKLGNIIIDPFNKANLANSSYDVRLGKYFYRQHPLHKHTQILNPFHKKSIQELYPELKKATPIKKLKSKTNPFYNLDDSDLVILIAPQETILAHTVEFIGGKGGAPGKCNAITTEMRARSSLGRIGIAVCKCAGWGDVGYINRWTMEITNFSTAIIPLVTGMRIAQIIFREVAPIQKDDHYHQKGKYQSASQLKKIKKSWRPEMMLPKLYKDPDIGSFQKYHKN